MSADEIDTSQWLTFFTRAGLPPNVSANYALIFSDNRIQLDMLMDLSKEYLYDMGIKVMGDVIAILRYAKEFHTQLAKERAIGKITSPPSKSAVAGRMVGHYTRASRASPNRPSPLKVETTLPKKGKVISLKRAPALEVPPPKKPRRVPPEEEGAYSIKLPQGTTEKTRKILQMSNTKRSVFARLGDSAVSSSTDTKKNSSSVFERLGASGKSRDDLPSSTVIEKKGTRGTPLQYQGVLKMTTIGKTRTVSASLQDKGTASTRTVFKPNLRLQHVPKTVNLNRINTILQSNKVPTSIGGHSRGILGKSVPASQRLGVKCRLGLKTVTSNNAIKRASKSSTSNVFERLGR